MVGTKFGTYRKGSHTAIKVIGLRWQVFHINRYRGAGNPCFYSLNPAEKIIKETTWANPLLHKERHVKGFNCKFTVLLGYQHCFFQYPNLVYPVVVNFSVKIYLFWYFNVLRIKTFISWQIYFIESRDGYIRGCIQFYCSYKLFAPEHVLFAQFHP